MQKNSSHLLLIFWLMFIPGNILQAQVNTEALRRHSLDPGWHHLINASVTYSGGNTEFLRLTGKWRSDLVRSPYYLFAVANYQRSMQSGNIFVNKGFVHLRGIRRLNNRVGVEGFLQREFNDFILLNDRILGGAGLRCGIHSQSIEQEPNLTVYLGIGGMYEYESLNADPKEKTNLWRSTNYLSVNWKQGKFLRLSWIGYYQQALSVGEDFRLLMQGSLGFQITEHLRYQTALDFRYDHRPQPGLKQHDIEVLNGLTLEW